MRTTIPAPSALPAYEPRLHLPSALALAALEAGVAPADVVAYVQARATQSARYSFSGERGGL